MLPRSASLSAGSAFVSAVPDVLLLRPPNPPPCSVGASENLLVVGRSAGIEKSSLDGVATSYLCENASGSSRYDVVVVAFMFSVLASGPPLVNRVRV